MVSEISYVDVNASLSLSVFLSLTCVGGEGR